MPTTAVISTQRSLFLNVGVNLARILGDAEEDPEGLVALVGGVEWRRVKKRLNFSLEMAFW